MTDDWMDDLRRLDGAVRPTGAALPAVRRALRRRRRLRAAGRAAGASALVAVVVVGVSLLPGTPGRGPVEREEGPATVTPTQLELFDCPTMHRVFTDESPPIPDLERQQGIIAEITSLVRNAFTVRHAEPTHLGVVALVMGNEEFAERELRRRGVAFVRPFEPAAVDVGLDAHAQIEQVVGWELDPVLRQLDRRTKGIAGKGGLAFWHDAAAVVLQWKAPVPPGIQALAGKREDGVTVYVDPTTYARKDIQGAQRRVSDAFADGHVDAEFSSSSACGDMSGLVVGITPKSLRDRRAELQAQLAGIAGMPVKVVPEELVVPLTEPGGPWEGPAAR